MEMGEVEAEGGEVVPSRRPRSAKGAFDASCSGGAGDAAVEGSKTGDKGDESASTRLWALGAALGAGDPGNWDSSGTDTASSCAGARFGGRAALSTIVAEGGIAGDADANLLAAEAAGADEAVGRSEFAVAVSAREGANPSAA